VRILFIGTPPQSYGASPAIWDHTVLPATRHKWTRPALTPASKLVLDSPTPEGLKAELTYLPDSTPAGSRTCDSRSQVQRPNHYTTEQPIIAYLLPNCTVSCAEIVYFDFRMFNCSLLLDVATLVSKVLDKNPNNPNKTLHSNMLLPYTGRTSEKGPGNFGKFRKSMREFSVTFDMF